MYAQLRLYPVTIEPVEHGTYPVLFDETGEAGICMGYFGTPPGHAGAGWFESHNSTSPSIEPLYWSPAVHVLKPAPARSARPVDEAKLRRLLTRFLKGDGPRCSEAEYRAICAIPGLSRALQRESANGADRSAGMILTALHDAESAKAAVRSYLDGA
jgi:hypothetical protein